MGRLKNISLKFIDIMIGVVLGLGFTLWANLHEAWQYAAFIFVYFDLVDYWIDYSSSLKKFPPRREIDLMFDVAIVFMMFLYIYATNLSILYFISTFIGFRILDTLWLLRKKGEHNPQGRDRAFITAWVKYNVVEIIYTSLLVFATVQYKFSAVPVLASFVILRLMTRILASLQYKSVYF